jgi:hypothetical protein
MNLNKASAKRLRLAGIALLLFSFVPGFAAFVYTPVMAANSFKDAFHYGIWNRALVGIALVIGWFDSFTVLFRLPRSFYWLAILAPWVLYIALMFLNFHPAVLAAWPDLSVASYWPFYPWATGIGLVHASRLLETNTPGIPEHYGLAV